MFNLSVLSLEYLRLIVIIAHVQVKVTNVKQFFKKVSTLYLLARSWLRENKQILWFFPYFTLAFIDVYK
jgi:hypothetical protein